MLKDYALGQCSSSPPYTTLVPHTRTLALDVGDRRIGIAITDVLGITAQPLFTLHRTSPRADLKAIARFIRQHKVEVVLIGNPLHADGAPSRQSEKSQAFAAALREFLAPTHPHLIFHLVDERLTTRDAHTLLDQSKTISSKSSRLTRSATIDQVAAVLLLEAWLSAGKPTLLPDPDSV
jgi:putative Holliday junction resolvase